MPNKQIKFIESKEELKNKVLAKYGSFAEYIRQTHNFKGITNQNLSRMLNPNHNITLVNFLKICEEVGVKINLVNE